MNQQNDLILSRLTVRIVSVDTGNTIGSGLIYYAENLKNKVYILTAAHCLFNDGDSFQQPLMRVGLEVYNPRSKSYNSTIYTINYQLCFPEKDKDVAVLLVEKSEIESLIEELPLVQAVKERQSLTTFVAKGFPNATYGREIACIQPIWAQEMTTVNKFQLNLK